MEISRCSDTNFNLLESPHPKNTSCIPEPIQRSNVEYKVDISENLEPAQKLKMKNEDLAPVNGSTCHNTDVIIPLQQRFCPQPNGTDNNSKDFQKLENTLDSCRMIDDALKASYKTSNQNRNKYESIRKSAVTQKQAKASHGYSNSDMFNTYDKNFAPLLKNKSHAVQGTVGASISKNMKTKKQPTLKTHNRNNTNQFVSYNKTMDAPIMQQTSMNKSKFDNNNFNKSPLPSAKKSQVNKVRRVKKTENAAPVHKSKNSMYQSAYRADKISNYLSNAKKSNVVNKEKVQKAKNYKVNTARDLLQQKRNQSKELKINMSESKIPRIRSTSRTSQIVPKTPNRQNSKFNLQSPFQEARTTQTPENINKNRKPSYLRDTKCSKGKLVKIIKTITNEDEWSHSLRDSINKRHRTPIAKTGTDFQFYRSNTPTDNQNNHSRQFYGSVNSSGLKELMHADSILQQNPDFRLFIDSADHEFSFSKDEGINDKSNVTNNTKVYCIW